MVFFVGPMIQIRPSDNHIWMDAAGEFQLPTAALPTSLSGRAEDDIRWTEAPHCRWQGEMVFDGHTAVLTGGVDITAALISGTDHWELFLKGDRLQVDLQGDVQVRDIDSVKNAKLGRISLLQSEQRPVLVQALRRAGDGVLEARHLMHAEKVTLVPGESESADGAFQFGAFDRCRPGLVSGLDDPLGWVPIRLRMAR